jgi:phenylacetate-CoA ligase
MEFRESFARKFYWPLAQKVKGENVAAALEELTRSQWWSQKELKYRQWRQVQRTVYKAISQVPFYQKYYKSVGITKMNADFSYDEFLKLPFVEKQSLRDHLSKFLNHTYRGRVTEGRTSGSTGISLQLKYNSEHESYSEAARWRAKSWWGVKPGSPHVSIWGRPFTGVKDRLNQKIKCIFMNNLLFSAFDLNDATLERIWQQIYYFKPAIIYGYPSAIYPLALYLKESDTPAERLGLKVIFTTAESITTQQRDLVESVFGCKTANEYGCSETGGFAYECPFGSWHISSEIDFVEYIGDDGQPVPDGETGDIIITHLKNDYMPLIRYRVGDRGAGLSGVCECGRQLPLMKVSVTKDSDMIKLEGYKKFSSEVFDYINLAVMKRYPASIRQFRVIQKSMHFFEVEVVPGRDGSGNAARLFEKLMHEQLGKDIQVVFKPVGRIQRESSGKLRYFISELN